MTVHLTTEAAADCRALAALASMVTWKHNHTGAAWLPVITNGPVPAVVSGTGAADVPATKTGVPVVKSAAAQVGADFGHHPVFQGRGEVRGDGWHATAQGDGARDRSGGGPDTDRGIPDGAGRHAGPGERHGCRGRHGVVRPR